MIYCFTVETVVFWGKHCVTVMHTDHKCWIVMCKDTFTQLHAQAGYKHTVSSVTHLCVLLDKHLCLGLIHSLISVITSCEMTVSLPTGHFLWTRVFLPVLFNRSVFKQLNMKNYSNIIICLNIYLNILFVIFKYRIF